MNHQPKGWYVRRAIMGTIAFVVITALLFLGGYTLTGYIVATCGVIIVKDLFNDIKEVEKDDGRGTKT